MPVKLIFTSAAQRNHTRFTKSLISRMDAIITTSPASAAYLDREATVILHGVDTKTLCPSKDKAVEKSREELPDGVLVGCFGRIRFGKGTDVFVDAMMDVMQNNSDVHAIITGLTTRRHKTFKAKLLARIETRRLADRFHWLGEMPPNRMPGLMRCLDLYAAPQRIEGFGLTPSRPWPAEFLLLQQVRAHLSCSC